MPNEPTALPQAFVTHRVQGRVRFRVPGMRNQSAYFETLRQRLAALPGLRRLTTNMRTGSVLIEHTGDLVELEALGQKLELFQLGPRPTPHTLSDYLYAATSKPDAFLKTVTDGRVDVAGLTVLALCGMGIKQVVAGHALPAGWTLLWNAANLIKDAGKPSKSD
jgi:hypothetical protein